MASPTEPPKQLIHIGVPSASAGVGATCTLLWPVTGAETAA
jgi:hypothetical protein